MTAEFLVTGKFLYLPAVRAANPRKTHNILAIFAWWKFEKRLVRSLKLNTTGFLARICEPHSGVGRGGHVTAQWRRSCFWVGNTKESLHHSIRLCGWQILTAKNYRPTLTKGQLNDFQTVCMFKVIIGFDALLKC